MTGFVVFEKATGKVLRTGDAPKKMIAIQASDAGEGVVEWSGETGGIYVDVENAAICRQTPIAATSQIDGRMISITGLPVPCVLQVDYGNPYEISDGMATIEFNLPGDYEIRVESVRFLPLTLKVSLT
jgi:hypothetical protein